MKIPTLLKRFLKLVRYGMLFFVGLIVIALFSFWIEMKSEVTLPAPTGSLAVGRTAFHWVDSTRTDSLTPEPHTKRELMVWIWYPASITGSDRTVEYIPADLSKALNAKRGALLNTFTTRDAAKIHAHSLQDAAVADDRPSYPVVLLRSAIGTLATDYTTFAEELASHGYIVVGSDAPYSTWLMRFPDGRLVDRTHAGNPGEAAELSQQTERILERLVRIWSADARFILDRLEELNSTDTLSRFHGRSDLGSVGVMGHSFGGATAAQFCVDDPRCKAGVDMDGAPYGTVVQDGLTKPFMFLLADHAEEMDPTSMRIKSRIAAIYNSLPASRSWIYLEGAQHFNFSDLPFQKEVFSSRLFGFTGSIGDRRGMEVISSCLLAFFDEHLKGGAHGMEDLGERYPEIGFAAQ